MDTYEHREMIPLGEDETPYQLLTTDYISTGQFEGQEILKVEPAGLTMLADRAIRDSAHLLRPAHLKQLTKILDDPEASDNDRFVAIEMLKNANIAAGGVLPMCQDTGTAIIMGKKGNRVWTDGSDEAALAHGITRAFLETNLRYSQLAPLDMFQEANTKTNLPAQIEIYAEQGDAYKFMFMAKGGGSANKSLLYQETRALLNPERLRDFIDQRLRELGTAACPPYHLALVIGGTSAEYTLKTAKLASAKYLDTLPTQGNEYGQAFRDLEMEKQVLEMSHELGIGAQFGGKYFCHDVRVIRLPRHGASCPVGIAVSCSADRQILGKITREGIFLEELESDPAKYLPEVDEEALSGDVAKIDLNQPMDKVRETLSKYPVSTRLSLSGPMIVATRYCPRQTPGTHRQRRRTSAILQEPVRLLRGTRQNTRGIRLRLIWSHNRRAHGQLRGFIPIRRRQHDHARQRQSLAASDRSVQKTRRILPRLHRRTRRSPRQRRHTQSRMPGISRTRHGSDMAHRSRKLSRIHRR